MKRLLRVDNEAVSVKLEVITEEELKANKRWEPGKDNLMPRFLSVEGLTMDPKDLCL